jgi:ferredoxin
MGHVERLVKSSRDEQLALLKSKESFMSWQSILRGVGVYSGCTRCVDVCPVGRDYDAHLKDAQEAIAERTPEKERRLAEMARRRETGNRGANYARSARWISGPIARHSPEV